MEPKKKKELKKKEEKEEKENKGSQKSHSKTGMFYLQERRKSQFSNFV
jgi:hypothetical protein